MQSSFFARVLRMKYINRWGLMRNTQPESLSVHTADVALLAHALAVLGNRRLGRQYNADRAAVLALYHDASEIITGDMPTPVKYHDERITSAYRQIEREANRTLCEMLPDDLREDYRGFFEKQPEDAELWRLVKAADKLSALIKCVEEEKSGNREFVQARLATQKALDRMELPEVTLFLEDFFGSFEKTLDELDSD